MRKKRICSDQTGILSKSCSRFVQIENIFVGRMGQGANVQM